MKAIPIKYSPLKLVLCANDCYSDEHHCGVPVRQADIESGEWERLVRLAHWSVLTHGGHDHKEPFCSMACLSDWAEQMLLRREPGFPIGDEPTNPTPFPEQRT